MAVDQTVAFNPNFLALATRAYRLLFGLSTEVDGGQMSNDQATQALLAANLMLKSWQRKGVNLYRRSVVACAINVGMGSPTNPFVFSPNVISVMNCNLVTATSPFMTERPMGKFEYLQYMRLPSKYNLSGNQTPNVYAWDRQVGVTNLYLFPLPNVACQVNAVVARIAADINATSSNVDLPQEWLETFVYCLADRLMDDEALADAAGAAQTVDRIQKRASALYSEVLDFDRPDSIFMEPMPGGSRTSRRR